MLFTILGAPGFIGSHLVRRLQKLRIEYLAPQRDDRSIFGRQLGHVIYCIGLTADFRDRSFDTVRAHVCYLLNILEEAEFESLLYLSTTRVYKGMQTSQEDSVLKVNPTEPNDLYNISKIMGESLCLSSKRSGVRIARLGNVYGRDFSSNNFLSCVIRDAIQNKRVLLQTTMASEKDFISIDDVVCLLPQIALSGRHRIYNVASGMNTSNAALLEVIRCVTGCTVEVSDGAETVIFPTVSIDRIRDEFDFSSTSILDSLGDLITEYERKESTR